MLPPEVTPLKTCILLRQLVQQPSYLHKRLDMRSVVAGQCSKGSDLHQVLWTWPFSYSLLSLSELSEL